MNNPAKKEHPEWMSDNDIAIYEQMIAIGRLQIGKEIAANEEYLLDLSAMITLRQLKGMTLALDDEAVVELKRIHQENFAKGLIYETPKSDFYASALALAEPYLSPEVDAEIKAINSATSNLVLDDVKKTSDIADETPDNDITSGYVKVVPRPIAEPVEPPAEP